MISFLVGYGLYCFETRIGKPGRMKAANIKNIVLKVVLFLLILGIQVFSYILGL
jgi:hypothetical protein